jgi:hypothetical protein
MRPCDPIIIISSPRASINGIEQYSDIPRSKEPPMEECKSFVVENTAPGTGTTGRPTFVYPLVFVERISPRLFYIVIHATSYSHLQNMGKLNSV